MNDEQQEPKKGFQNSFVFFLMAALLLILMVQNFMDVRAARVSFSYQIEHLVNLELIQPEDSRKTALNDNLVTFSGRFRQRPTEDGKNRFKFLELLDTNHQLRGQTEELQSQLASLRERMTDAAQWFLLLSGQPISSKGYVVVDETYEGIDPAGPLVIRQVPPRNVASLATLSQQFSAIHDRSTMEQIDQYGNSLQTLVKSFRSPLLGIGNAAIKQSLDQIDLQLQEAQSSGSVAEQIATYRSSLASLQQITSELNQFDEHVRLAKLRSVRNYVETLRNYEEVSQLLDENQTQLDKARETVSSVIWYFNNNELSTRTLEKQDSELYHQWFLHAKAEWDHFEENRGAFFKAPDQPLNTVLEKTFRSEEPAPNYFGHLFTFLPILLVLLLLYFLFTRQMKGVGSNAMNFGKSPAKLLQKGTHKLTFKDVAGVDEAIEELQEIVEFLKNPQKFTALGGRIPKGVLCIGPPGTGKTLIAKAVAGEADRPFFSISGSDFVEMFVGVGASRIRDMFDQAKKNAPCIIFMDEIDAVGRHRGAGIGGGHDEREQTLNQLLVEMDGFDTNDGVILMAATNRPDVLDKALLRPGRFDRRIIISLPDIRGRYDILKVHARKIKLDSSVDLMAIARSTPGASGADLGNLLNESALLAARRGRTAVTAVELNEARDKVLYGKERRSLELDENEKRTTAYHESGHAIVGLIVEHSDPVDKITIIPRGLALGATMFLPRKNRVSYWKKELHDQLAVLMGGRVAEELFVGDVSSGAQQDIERATSLARSMVCEWGMSAELGTVAYDERSQSGMYLGMQGFHEKKYSEATAQLIDDEVRRLLDKAHAEAKQIIQDNREKVELLTQMLLLFETLEAEDVKKIMDGTWSEEGKRLRLKVAEELYKMSVPPVQGSPKPSPSAGSSPLTQGASA